MYHAFVRHKLTQTFEGLDRDTFAASLAGMDPKVEHAFGGRTPSGVRATRLRPCDRGSSASTACSRTCASR